MQVFSMKLVFSIKQVSDARKYLYFKDWLWCRTSMGSSGHVYTTCLLSYVQKQYFAGDAMPLGTTWIVNGLRICLYISSGHFCVLEVYVPVVLHIVGKLYADTTMVRRRIQCSEHASMSIIFKARLNPCCS
jgi:hypothetical protein